MSAPSRRTVLFALVGMCLVALLWFSANVGALSNSASVAIVDFGGVAVLALCVGAIFWSAYRLGAGPIRTQWLLVGTGVGLFALGDLAWAWIEVVQRAEIPYPGLPDVFYLAMYVFLGAGIVLAGFAYRGLFDLKRPSVLAVLVAAALSAGLWMLFLGTLWGDAHGLLGERLLNVAYPLADTLLLVGPAAFVLMITGRLQGGLLGRPWMAVCGGALLLALTDTGYSFLTAADAYEPGMLVDYGWLAAFVLVATGALIALDIATPAVAAAQQRKAA